MKTGILILLVSIIAFVAGMAVNRFYPAELEAESRHNSDSDSDSDSDSVKPLYWVAPMDSNYKRDKPGKSPMGMELVPVYPSSEDPYEVKINPAVEHNLGVTTSEVLRSELTNNINTVGYVRFDEDRLHHIHMRVEGWIEKLNVSAVGETVKEGQVLFEVYSPTLFNAQKDLVSVLKSGNKELINSAQQRLRLLGMDKKQIQKVVADGKANERIQLVAKSSGVVSNLNVRHGMYIDPASEVMAIGSIDTVWVIAEVFERQSGWLQKGQHVSITSDSYPGEQWQATVDYIYPVLNADSRTVQVRVRVENNDQRLKPNMFTNLVIHSQNLNPVVNIPRSALIRGGHNQRVVKVIGDGRYRSVIVKTGFEAGGRVEIISGLQAGEHVVSAAQFLIDSESNIDAAVERMATKSSDDDTIKMESHHD